MTRKSILLTSVLPAVAAAQETPVSTGSSATAWLIAFVAIAVVALAFWQLRTMKARRGPHGPQSPTPRGP